LFLPAVVTLAIKRREVREVRRARSDLRAVFGLRSAAPLLTGLET